MASVRLDGVSKRFGDTEAVSALDLDIEDGSYCVLVGPSGCGKSTTLRMIAGLEEVSTGTIAIGGERVDDVPPHRRDIAFVFQGYALYPHLSVRANLAFGLERRRRRASRVRATFDGAYRGARREESTAIAARVAEVAQQLELEPLLDRRPAELSGGQQQRVALGRALVRDPKVFLLDEPLSNLDARLRANTRVELAELQRRVGGTFVHVTHDQEEALALADRIVVMSEGRLQQVGAPDAVHRTPTNRFVAGFVGQPRMNFVDGRATSGRFEGGGLVAPVDAPHAGAAVLGLRPTDLAVEARAAAGALGSGALVDLRDFGDHLDLRVAASPDGEPLVVRTTRRALAAADLDGPLEPGRALALVAAPGSGHLFEPGPFGARLGAAG